MRYALLIYNNNEAVEQRTQEESRRVIAAMAEALERPNVTGWLRLQEPESATTVRDGRGKPLLTDGPFVDSKDYLGGFIVVEVANLDEALAFAGELQELRGPIAPIEVRPVREEPLVGA